MKRRAFLQAIGTVGAGSFLSCTSAAKIFRGVRVEPRIAVPTYSFRGYIVSDNNNRRNPALPGMDLVQFAQFVVSEYKLQAVEIVDKHFASTDLVYLNKLKSAFSQSGVKLVNIPMDLKIHLCGGDADERERGFDLHKQWIDIAAMLGCPSIRPRVPSASPSNFDVDCAVNVLGRLADYGKSKGVVVNLENDNPVTESYTNLITIIQRVNSPFLRALPDFANSLAGGGEAFNTQAMKALFPYATNITHAKDWEHIHGKVEYVDLAEIVSIAKNAGFQGWYSIESDSDDDPRGDTHRILAALLHCLESPSKT